MYLSKSYVNRVKQPYLIDFVVYLYSQNYSL